MHILRHTILCLVILAIGGTVVWFIQRTEPEAKQKGAVAETAMLVETTTVDYGTFRPTIHALGTVRPAREVTLSARVPGYVVDISDDFEPGALVNKGDILLELDPSDFRNQIAEQRSALKEARANLQMEQGRQDVARSDLELLNNADLSASSASDTQLSKQDRQLVLRKPQLMAAKAQVSAAKSSLRQAQLELHRSRIRAPFNAQILSRKANIGSQVSTGTPLGRLVGTDVYWVIATLPQSRLRWLRFNKGTKTKGNSTQTTSTKARIREQTSWPEGVYREGQFLRTIGTLTEETRLARILIEVPDPLAKKDSDQKAPPLLLGAFVQVSLKGKALKGVARIQRNLLRNDNTVWVIKNGKLDIRNVDVVVKNEEYAYISKGLNSDDHIVKTNLASVVEDAPLRVKGKDPSGTASSTTGEEDLHKKTPSEDSGGNP